VRRPTGLVAALATRRGRVEDVRRRMADAGVERSFLVCTTPRTGSTLLADMLAMSGAGRADELFNPHTVPPGSRIELGEYLARCAERSARSGSFAIKLHWDQHQTFLGQLRRLRRSGNRSDGELIASVLPGVRYVLLTRDDVVAQGVSWWKAKQTRVWHDGDEPQADAVFDYDAIDERVRMAREQTEAWREWLRKNGLDYHAVVYEQLVRDPVEVTATALVYLGVTSSGGPPSATRTRRQADGLNDEWVRRYRELAEAR
jgi:LPS sulfotransferase NodH